MFPIIHRYTKAELYRSETAESLREATIEAVGNGANLVGANLARANLDGANLARANLDGASLDGANLVGANLARANLDGASLDGASLDGANLDGASLDGANLARANLDGASLDGANLARANLDGASLDGASLDGANLARANLDGASLDGANLDGANLDGASLDGASLDGANLARANLDGASLDGANLDGANLDGANLDGDVIGEIQDKIGLIVDPQLPQQILNQIATHPESWDQESWHSACNTRHCIAGFAVHLSGQRGRLLESFHGTQTAATLLLWRSGCVLPSFSSHATEDETLGRLRVMAERALSENPQ